MRSDDQVKVIGHEAIPQHPHRQPLRRLSDHVEERVVIRSLVKDLGATVAAVEQVIAIVGNSGSCSAWHDQKIDDWGKTGKKK